ncbi:MAG: D-glycerate dehydrogenase [Solirubrobacteraceae bacterium]|nr:D-glycerate dehydrogenase [Solirubrobacteraceae bacterium]
MARVFVTRELPGDAVGRLTAAGHEVTVHPGDMPPTREQLAAGAAGADGLLSMLTDRIDVELLDKAPSLRAIANYVVGSDNIDLGAAQARGIAVGVTPDVLTDATADLAMALLLSAARRLPQAAADVRGGAWRTWEPAGWLGLELRGARLVLIGYGRIGRAVGERAAAFGMEVEPVGRGDDLHAALGRADVVSLHAPLTDKTRHLIDAAALDAIKPGAILVNTARGGLVDQEALARALRAGRLAAAALDVTDPEPLPADDPLLAAPNLLVVPHIGSATRATRARMADMAAANLLAALAGEPMPHPAIRERRPARTQQN